MKPGGVRRTLPLIMGSIVLLSLAAVFIVLQFRNDTGQHAASENTAPDITAPTETDLPAEQVSEAAQTSPEESSTVIDGILHSFGKEDQPDYPVVRLKTAIYPDFKEAGLDTVMEQNPLYPRHNSYAMLFDSETVILSEPVKLAALPEGTDSVTLWFSYDPERVSDRLSHMQVMYFDTEDTFQELTGAEIDEEQHRISVSVSETGVYYVYDTNSYARLQGEPTDTPLFYRNPTVGFEAMIPAEVMCFQYGISFQTIEEQFLPDEICRYDNDGARYIMPLIFTETGSDPGISDFRMEWVTDCRGADAAADACLDAINEMNRNQMHCKVIRDETDTLPDGTHRRIIVTTAPANGDIPAQTEFYAYYDLKPGEIVTFHYVMDTSAKERLYDKLADSFDTFRKTGTALQTQ